MAEYVYTDPASRAYPEGRDAQDRPLGTVEPGEIRDLAEAPDQFWSPATDEDRQRREQALAAGDTPAADDEDNGDDNPPDDNPPAPDGAQPAAPAIIPGA